MCRRLGESGVPFDHDVALVSLRRHVHRCRWRGLRRRRLLAHLHLINEQRVLGAVGAALQEHDALQLRREEWIDRRTAQRCHRDADLHPPVRGQIADEAAE